MERSILEIQNLTKYYKKVRGVEFVLRTKNKKEK